MKSRKSFYKNAVIKQDFRQFGWISLVYLVSLLFSLPLGLLQIASRKYVIFSDYKNYLMVNPEIQIVLYFAVPVAAGLLLFRYIQNEASVDMVHSLPIKREVLYFSHVISGLLLLIVPIIITAVITYFVTNTIEEFSGILTITDLLSWIGIVTLLTCMMFSFSIAVGFITGMSTVQAILTYILLFLPIGMVTMVTYNLSFLLFGFTTAFIEEQLMYLSPFLRFVGSWGEPQPYSTLEIMIYLIFTVLFFGIGLVLYKLRQLERATDVIAFPFLKPIFKYGVTFCSMILGGSYFSATGDLNWNWIIFGYIIGALIGYTVAEMVLLKTWRILRLHFFTGFIVYSVIFIAVLLGIKTDLINYEANLPKMEQIEEVYFGNKYDMQELIRNDIDPFSNNKLYIQDVRNLHEEIIHQKAFIESQQHSDINKVQGFITYRMKNGKQFTREYQLPADALQKDLTPVMESEGYIVNKPEFFQLQREDILNMRINPVGPGHHTNTITISDKKEIEEFRRVLEKDILSQSIEDIVSPATPWAYIDIEFKRSNNEEHFFDGYSIDWKKSYDNVTKWLDEHGYLEDARIDVNDIKEAELTIVNPQNQAEEMFSPEEYYQTGQKHATITDKESLTSIIRHFTEYSSDHTYYVKLILKDGNEWYGSIPDKYLTDQMKEQIK
jgi:ABC-2 type transport system permease protein